MGPASGLRGAPIRLRMAPKRRIGTPTDAVGPQIGAEGSQMGAEGTQTSQNLSGIRGTPNGLIRALPGSKFIWSGTARRKASRAAREVASSAACLVHRLHKDQRGFPPFGRASGRGIIASDNRLQRGFFY